jgi:hypothetical protein
VVITIEGNEEGGTEEDLIYYMKSYSDLIGDPNVVICLDSDAFRDDTLVISSSLRGCISKIIREFISNDLVFDIEVCTFKENLHSGYSGIVPDPYLIAMTLVGRLVDFNTHKVIEPFHVDIPEHRKHECNVAAERLPSMLKLLPTNDDLKSIAQDSTSEQQEKYELIINSTWLP